MVLERGMGNNKSSEKLLSFTKPLPSRAKKESSLKAAPDHLNPTKIFPEFAYFVTSSTATFPFTAFE
jgi:hypothetical protein